MSALTISIRSAMASEQQALEALQRCASLANAGDRNALLANPDAIMLPVEQIAAGRVFVAESAGRMLGFAAVLPREDGDAELDGLFVEPQLWRSGVGRTLVEHSAAFAHAGGARVLHVIANPHAGEFYRTCGFEPAGPHKTRFGVGVRMRKRL